MAGFNATIAGVGDNKLDVYGATDVSISTLTFLSTDTYLTGGYTGLTAAAFGLSRPILSIEVIGMNTAGLGMVWIWNTQTSALMAYWSGTASAVLNQVANTTSLNGVVLTVRVTGQR